MWDPMRNTRLKDSLVNIKYLKVQYYELQGKNNGFEV